MNRSSLRIITLIWLIVFSLGANGQSLDPKTETKVEAALRMIGHEVLLIHGDSTSRVLPIEKEGDKYVIKFESEFELFPVALAIAVDTVMRKTNISKNYIVETQFCETGEIGHSYGYNSNLETSEIACGARNYPKGCYNLLVTLLHVDKDAAFYDFNVSDDESIEERVSYSSVTLFMIPAIILLAVLYYFWKGRREDEMETDSGLIAIGDFKFDEKNMKLVYADSNIELTSKEADLLSLLRSSANTTVERDEILKHVWGDNGDYVGRTLDVFISKLRKKLEPDPKIRIANIRGVGYKLVLN